MSHKHAIGDEEGMRTMPAWARVGGARRHGHLINGRESSDQKEKSPHHTHNSRMAPEIPVSNSIFVLQGQVSQPRFDSSADT